MPIGEPLWVDSPLTAVCTTADVVGVIAWRSLQRLVELVQRPTPRSGTEELATPYGSIGKSSNAPTPNCVFASARL